MENLRKMLFAMSRDIRVILIKIADRLHNMRTMEYQTPEKQRSKSRETMQIYAPKGGGSENMSSLKMLTPAAGRQGVIDFVVESVIKAGGNPCPPTVVGVGIGGTFEKAAFLAKKALIRPMGEASPDPEYAEMEREILARINASGVGPQGLGGDTTSFAVHIEHFPCHIASLPVAVNLNCHAARHAGFEL